jgi:hypothetical protein
MLPRQRTRRPRGDVDRQDASHVRSFRRLAGLPGSPCTQGPSATAELFGMPPTSAFAAIGVDGPQIMSGSPDVGRAIQPSVAARSCWLAGGVVTRPSCTAGAVRGCDDGVNGVVGSAAGAVELAQPEPGRDGEDRIDQLPQSGYAWFHGGRPDDQALVPGCHSCAGYRTSAITIGASTRRMRRMVAAACRRS